MTATVLDMNQESIPPVGVIGRTLRVLTGGFQFYFVWAAVNFFAALRYESLEDQPIFWAFTALGIYFLPWIMNLGFHKVFRIGRQYTPCVQAYGRRSIDGKRDFVKRTDERH